MCLLLRSNYPEILITLEESGTAILSDRPRLYLLSFYPNDNCLSTQADFSVRLWSHQVYGPQQRHSRSWGQCVSSSGFIRNWMRKRMWLAMVSEEEAPSLDLFLTPLNPGPLWLWYADDNMVRNNEKYFQWKQTINIVFLIFPIRTLLAAVQVSHPHRIKCIKIKSIQVVCVHKKDLTALCAAKARAALDFYWLMEQNKRLPVQK